MTAGSSPDHAEGVRHAMRQRDVSAGLHGEGFLAAAHRQPSRDQVEGVVEVLVNVQRGAAAWGNGRLDDDGLAGLVRPDNHERVEEPVRVSFPRGRLPEQPLGGCERTGGDGFSHGSSPLCRLLVAVLLVFLLQRLD
jgi:hypothetical protein